MNALAEIIKSLSAFAWPGVVGCALWAYRKQLKRLLASLSKALSRLSSAEVSGFKFALGQVSSEVTAAVEPVNKLPSPPPESVPEVSGTFLSLSASAEDDLGPSVKPITDPAVPILAVAGSSPHSAVFLAGNILEKQLKVLLATTGLLKEYVSPPQAIRLLEGRGLAPSSLATAIDGIWKIRNQIRHMEVPPDLAAEVVDQAVRIVRLVAEVPRNYHQVIFTEVPLYYDPHGLALVGNAKGVILRGVDRFNQPSGTTQIFPTTRQMRVGDYVSWEWNLAANWDETWYRDPVDHDLRTAWSSCAEFIGRNIESLG